MVTKKKITHIPDNGEAVGNPNNPNSAGKTFVPTSESKSKATTLRLIAGLLWLVAIAAQVIAIYMLFRPPVSMMWLIILIVTDLAMVLIGSALWKKSNRLDPASEKEKFKFFMQNQLGVVASVVAFLPLVIFVLTNKNIDKKQKGILAAVAGGALAIAGIFSADFNPPSVEQYTEETNRVEWLNEGRNDVYWTKAGTVYHIYDDCPYINTSKTDEIFEGTVAQARELKNITRLCSRCEDRAIVEHDLEDNVSVD